MHSPEVVAWDIPRPWPEIRNQRPHATHRWPFVELFGRELYFPSLITIWHIEPNGEDALQGKRRGTRWKWHIHHWQIQFVPWRTFRRRFLTRCGWCGEKDRSGAINHSYGYVDDPSRWWQGEQGNFHAECLSAHSAHRICGCAVSVTDVVRSGHTCKTCGKFVRFGKPKGAAERLLTDKVPEGVRPSKEIQDRCRRLWEYERRRDAVDDGSDLR